MSRASNGLLTFGILAGMLGGASYYAHRASSGGIPKDVFVEDAEIKVEDGSVTGSNTEAATVFEDVAPELDIHGVSAEVQPIDEAGPRLGIHEVSEETPPIIEDVPNASMVTTEVSDDASGTLITSISDDESTESIRNSDELHSETPAPAPKWLCDHYDWNHFQSMQATTGFVESILGGCVYRLTNVTVTGPDNVTLATVTSEIFDSLTKKIIVRRVETKMRSVAKLLQFSVTEDFFDIQTGQSVYSRRFEDDEQSPTLDSDEWQLVSGNVSP